MGIVSTSPKRPSAVVARHAGEFTVTEIASRLNLPEGTVYSWLYKGRLPARRVEAAWHTLWLVRLEDVKALLQQRMGAARLPPRPAASR
jgi:excisionase family DNA binding protein